MATDDKFSPDDIHRTLDELREKLNRQSRSTKDVMALDYQTEYLVSYLWRKIKRRIFIRDNKRCRYCGGVAEVVHHRSYDREVLEGNADQMLVSLCNACHNFLHFDDDGLRRSMKVAEQIFLHEPPQSDFPEPIRGLRFGALPVKWDRMNQIQRDGWVARDKQLNESRRAALKEKQVSQAAESHKRLRELKALWITLRDAIDMYRKEKGAPSNSYDWYRNSAMHRRVVRIGQVEIGAEKRGGVWHVQTKSFRNAIKKHCSQCAKIAKMTEDYKRGTIHGKTEETIETEWGQYTIHGKFRFVVSDYSFFRAKIDDGWRCNNCHKQAELQEEGEGNAKSQSLYCHACGHKTIL